MKATALLVLLCAAYVCFAYDVHYNDHKVVRAYIPKPAVETLEKMEVDVWSRDGILVGNAYNDIRASPELISVLEGMQSDYSVIINDVETHIRNEAAANRKRSVANFHDAYHSYAEIMAFLTNITNGFPQLAKLNPSIGQSIEGRDIPAVEVVGGKSATKSIFISGGQHAREWIAPATVLYILEQLLNGYGKDQATTDLVDKYKIYIVPLVNPDGYEFSRTNNRLWRKNRRHNSGSTYGVDLNRNWDEHWCQYGSSKSPSSDTYCGTAAFSEPETKAVSTYISSQKHSAVIDFHSYGQLVLRPYGWTVSPAPTETLLKSVGDGIAATIKTLSGKVYTSETGADLYPASGAADDWSYSVAKVPYVYTIELRDTGSYGFQLPANQIVPTGQEAYAALKYLSTRIQ